jgi:hypothetical protein
MLISLKIKDSLVSLDVPPDTFFHTVDKKFMDFMGMFDKFDEVLFETYDETDGKALILAYCKCMELNINIPESLKSYFYNSFNRFLNGERLEKSLGLVNPAQRPKSEKNSERDKAIYRDVAERMKKGITLLEAAMEMSDKYRIHESNIQKIYSTLKRFEDLEIPF